METIGIILLAVIAYFLWKIYSQKEEEKAEIANEKYDAEWEAKKKEEFSDYPHLIGKVDYTWLELFGKHYVEKNLPFTNATFLMYLKESNNTKLDIMEV